MCKLSFRGFFLASAIMGPAFCASAAEPVRQVSIYVQPFYEAARNPGERPRVAVGKRFDALLASNNPEDVTAARDLIAGEPKFVTPMALMVLAIRLYDVGLRDEAVFWFYAAKDRYIAFTEVIEAGIPALAQADEAVRSFATLAGPVINGYAFCDLAKQRELRIKALAWVESNPYGAMFLPQIPARGRDRQAAFAQAVRSAKANAEKESRYFHDPKNAESFYATRKKNEADTKYCWR